MSAEDLAQQVQQCCGAFEATLGSLLRGVAGATDAVDALRAEVAAAKVEAAQARAEVAALKADAALTTAEQAADLAACRTEVEAQRAEAAAQGATVARLKACLEQQAAAAAAVAAARPQPQPQPQPLSRQHSSHSSHSDLSRQNSFGSAPLTPASPGAHLTLAPTVRLHQSEVPQGATLTAADVGKRIQVPSPFCPFVVPHAGSHPDTRRSSAQATSFSACSATQPPSAGGS